MLKLKLDVMKPEKISELPREEAMKILRQEARNEVNSSGLEGFELDEEVLFQNMLARYDSEVGSDVYSSESKHQWMPINLDP